MKKFRALIIFAGICSLLTASGVIAGADQVDIDSLRLAASSGRNQALPELSESSTLSDYLKYAALNNPGLEASFNRFKAAIERITQARSLPDPKFTYQYFVDEAETRVGAQRESFKISQMFPWFGKLELKGDIAAQAANSAKQNYEAAKLKLFYDVKNTYYEYYYLSKAIETTRENVALMKHLEGVARTRFKTAIGSHPDVIRAQVELGKLDDRHQSLLEMRGPIAARLNAALNRPVGAGIPWPKQIELEDISLEDKLLLKELVENNPQLKAIEFEIAKNKENIELAKKNYFPDITVGVGIVKTDNSVVGNPRDNGKDPIIGMVTVNVPIWWEKYAASVREAKAKYSSSVQLKTAKTNSLSSELKMILYRFDDAGRKIALYRDTLLPKARESLKVTEATYRAGGSFNDLVDAQRILLEFTLAYERALADHAQSLARLEMLVAGQIPAAGNEKG